MIDRQLTPNQPNVLSVPMVPVLPTVPEGLATVPRAVWTRSERPFWGRVLRFIVPLWFLGVGLFVPIVAVKLVLFAVAIMFAAALPTVVDLRLQALDRACGPCSAAEAEAQLRDLGTRRLVAWFAPCAWVSIRTGQLALYAKNWREAARAFSEAARQAGAPEQAALVGAQAHALTRAGDRRAARELLTGLESRHQLRPLDCFNLAIAYVEEPDKTSRAVELLEHAGKQFDASAVDAALALAYARSGDTQAATHKLDALQSRALEDELGKELLKRAKRAVRKRN